MRSKRGNQNQTKDQDFLSGHYGDLASLNYERNDIGYVTGITNEKTTHI
jgi:hypothetical protein